MSEMPKPLRPSPMVGETERSVRRELRQTIAELELCSHVPAAPSDFEIPAERRGPKERYRASAPILIGSKPHSHGHGGGLEIGGKRPPGGIDHEDDRSTDAHLRSAEHYKRRMAKAHSEKTLQAILEEAKLTLRSWKRQPEPEGIEPERMTLAWKRMIANSPRTAEGLSKSYMIGVRTVHRYRALYGEKRDREAA